MNHPITFRYRENKTKLVPVFFLMLRNSYEGKINFDFKSVIVIIFLHYLETN